MPNNKYVFINGWWRYLNYSLRTYVQLGCMPNRKNDVIKLGISKLP